VDDGDVAQTPKILLVSGSLRDTSTNSSLLRTAAVAWHHVAACRLYDRLARLPAFNPDDDRPPLDHEVESLRDAIHTADAIVFSTPEYAGALPGSFKNLLDWTIGDEGPGSIYEKPVGWLNPSPRGAHGAYGELRTVLGYAHANVIDAACAHLPIRNEMIGSDGLVDGDTTRIALAHVFAALRSHLTAPVSAPPHEQPAP
jgi:NAD(P)H-dependent FMN reductase